MVPEGTQERLVFFPCEGATLAGVLTLALEPNGRTILIPWGAGAFPSSGRNRIRARFARTLAELGFHAFRFDYLGVGESDGEYQKPDLTRPNIKEIVAASEWLTSEGFSRIIVVGHCFGGWSSLLAAPMISGLEGMAVVNAPVRRDHKQIRRSWRWWVSRVKKLTAKKLLSAEHRAAYRKLIRTNASSAMRSRSKAPSTVGSGVGTAHFSSAVKHLLKHRIPLLLMYGDDDFRADLESELDRGLSAAIAEAGPLTRLVMVPEHLEGCASLDAQDALLKGIVPWLQELPELS
jgi:pimeloyl-ACP methyl ester carboxylesterase